MDRTRNMFQDHFWCIAPKDNAKIWRYMNLTKFTDLLNNKSLYFCRLDKLGDSFEGSLPRVNYQLREKVANKLEITGHDGKGFRRKSQTFSKNIRLTFYMNCWHLNNHESDAMWKLYAGAGGGIAVSSTVERLKRCVSKAQDTIRISKVKYIDYDKDGIPIVNCFAPALHKRKSFSHERELRAFVWEPNNLDKIKNNQQIEQGLPTQIELEELIDEIYISPLEDDWFASVKSIMKQYGLNKTLRHSKLSDSPLI